MKNKDYDEFQLANRHRIAFQTLFITFVVIMINGYVKFIYGNWADPLLEMMITVLIPGMYFTIMSIAKNAYLRQKDHPIVFIVMMGMATILSGAAVISSIMSGILELVEDGQLTNQVGSLLLTIYAGSTTVALLMRSMKNRRVFANEES
ncbi:hypothetical protein [Sporosarcina pasteurii]|uniref:Uncharacterized protein n=1 Tax=Sporosarcina pasteurii TaxID=1474 RepID=A0A380C183_SPOPA|nr:hypothetical protein [Sporosarcina pasteurii]MDS9471563.1 hypothetical protein [Sporosarcina pasteurii]QBQ04822.1 hypothetical protein E2C16_03655 [Sporosarcina pasteurii]SUJ11108.1 Uncharacterised protein [Sporosarcina pasteurii]